MKTVVLIAPYFPPRRRVGSLRPFKFAIHLRENGWEPVVLTINYPGDLTAREQKLLDGIRVLQVKSPFDKTTNRKSEGKKSTLYQSWVDRFVNWIDKNTPVDSWIFLFWLKYVWILKQVKKVQPNLIWSTGDPWSGHWLAEKLSNAVSVPWVADFRDPWTLTKVNLRQRSAFSSKADKFIERRVIENADKLIFTSLATEKTYAEHYGFPSSKSATIYNSFDRSLFFDDHTKNRITDFDSRNLHIFFYGSFRRLSPVAPIAKAIYLLKKTDSPAASFIRIHSFGASGEHEKKYIRELGIAENFVEHPSVLPEQTLSVLNRADVLLVSSHPDRKHIIPAKLWDYLATERPICSIAPNPEIQTILERSKAGIQVSPEEPKHIAETFRSFLHAKHKGELLFTKGENLGSARKEFDAAATTVKLVSIFDELTTDG